MGVVVLVVRSSGKVCFMGNDGVLCVIRFVVSFFSADTTLYGRYYDITSTF